MAKFLVTGGAGFIGSHLVEYLVRLREQVVVLDDCSTGSRANLQAVESRITFQAGDVCDPAAVAKAVAGCDYVLHQAAMTSVAQSVVEPVKAYRVNAEGTLRVLEAAKAASVKRVVLASSSSIYGDAAISPKVETMAPEPRSPYAASKLAAEALGQAYTHGMDLPVVALRYFNVYGPRQAPDSPHAAAIPRFAAALLGGKLPEVYGDGEQTRDFTYVDDVVAAVVLAVRQGTPGAVYNIAAGQAVSIRTLLKAIAKEAGVPPKATKAPARAGDVRHSLADIGRARKDLGFEPTTALEEGLRRTVAWFRKARA